MNFYINNTEIISTLKREETVLFNLYEEIGKPNYTEFIRFRIHQMKVLFLGENDNPLRTGKGYKNYARVKITPPVIFKDFDRHGKVHTFCGSGKPCKSSYEYKESNNYFR